MQNLGELNFLVSGYHAAVFAMEFAISKILLLRVETLIVGPGCEFALKMCPNVKNIHSGSRWHSRPFDIERYFTRDLIKAAETAVNLTRLEIIKGLWTPSLLQGRLVVKLLLSELLE